MKTLEQQIIEKQDELLNLLITGYGERFKDNAYYKKVESELSALKSQLKEQEVGFFSSRIGKSSMSNYKHNIGSTTDFKVEQSQSAEEFLIGKIGKLQYTEIEVKDSLLVDWIEEYASQKHPIVTDEGMNQKAVEYGKLKNQRRFRLTDYEQSEAEIDFLRGYDAAINDMKIKG